MQSPRKLSEPTASSRRGRGARPAARGARQGLGDGRDELHAVDALPPDQLGQLRRIEQDVARAGDQRAAGGQGRTQSPVKTSKANGAAWRCRRVVPRRP